MSRTIAGTPFKVSYKTEVAGIIRGYHVYKEVWEAVIGEMLEATSDNREKAKEHDKNAVGLYKKDILVAHIPIYQWKCQVSVSVSSIKIQGTK